MGKEEFIQSTITAKAKLEEDIISLIMNYEYNNIGIIDDIRITREGFKFDIGANAIYNIKVETFISVK